MRMQEMEAQTERILMRIFKGYDKPMTSNELDAFVGYTKGVIDTLHDLTLISDSRYDKLWDKLWDKNYDLYLNKEVTQ